MAANLLCNRRTFELPCELLQTVLIFQMQLTGKDVKYCLDFQDLEFFGWARRGEKILTYK